MERALVAARCSYRWLGFCLPSVYTIQLVVGDLIEFLFLVREYLVSDS